MKIKVTFIVLLVLIATLFTGCGKKTAGTDNAKNTPAPTTAANTPAPTTAAPTTAANTPAPTTPATDVVTTASIVNDEAAFEKAMSKNGTWIIAALRDMTFDKDLVLEGEFKNGKKDESGKELIQRKVALYTQDENRVVTNRFTLTAPKLTVTSPMASIQHGTFKGDLYIAVTDFQLVDATVDGNVYFASADAQKTFKMDETSKITGKQELQK